MEANLKITPKELGAGAYGNVYVSIDPTNNKRYAIKIFNSSVDESMDCVQEEFKLADVIDHPNCLKVRSFGKTQFNIPAEETTRQAIYTISEMYRHGELFDMIVEAGGFEEPVCRFFFKQLMEGLKYMHQDAGYSHRDLKGENVLLEGGVIKIIDFGMACEAEETRPAGELAGTEGYQPPEYLEKKSYKGSSWDIFSAGVILYQMRAANNPFGMASVGDKYFKILTKKPEKYWAHQEKAQLEGNTFSDEFKQLIGAMFNLDPAQRPTAEACLNSPWMSGPIATLEEVVQQVANVIIERDGRLDEQAEVYQEIMDAITAEMGDGTDRAWGDHTPQDISIEDVSKTSFVCQYAPEQLAELVERHCEENEVEFEKDEPNYTMEITDTIKTVAPVFNEETDEVSEEEELKSVTMKMQVFNIVDKEGLFCVEFSKIKGNLIDYHKVYARYRDEVLAPAITTHKLTVE